MDVGKPAVDAVVADRQLRVVDAQEMQDGRVDVVDFGRLLAIGGLLAEFVAGVIPCASGRAV